MKWIKRTLIAFGLVLAVAALFAGWLLETQSGLDFALARAEHATGGALSVAQARGRLAGPLTLTGVRYRDTASGLDVRAGRVHVDLRVLALLAERAHLLDLELDDIDVALPTRPATASTSSGPVSLQAPIDIVLDRAHVGHVRVHRGNDDLFVSDSLDLAGTWTRDRLELHRLALRAPAGRVDLDGRVTLDGDYPGKGHVRFDWMAGGRHWVGTVQADNDGGTAKLDARLAQPMKSSLAVQLTPHAPFDWKAQVTVPASDPAPLLGPGTLKQLAADLSGSGDRRHASLHGSVDLDGTRVRLSALDAKLSADDHTLVLERVALDSPQVQGTLQGRGQLRLDPAPMQAELHVAWSDVVLPAELAGQKLASHGSLDARGTPDAYQVTLDGQAGPPGKLSDLHAEVRGSTREVHVKTLTVKQPRGSLEASGDLVFAPRFSWSLHVTSTRFDPGQLLAGWSGALDSKLDTQGRLADAGPDAKLQLQKLSGTLRQRAIRGHGDLHLSPQRVVDGDLRLALGGDDVHLQARKGARNDIALHLDITSLGNWVPAARGALQGDVRVRGLWPKLAVAANLDGHALRFRDQRAGQLKLHADVKDITHPGGTLRLHAADVNAGGFAFDTLDLDGHGDRGHHAVSLRAKGPQLALDTALSGGMKGDAWTGTLSRLDLTPDGLPTWSLRHPVALHANGREAGLDTLCLSPGKPELCLHAARHRNGTAEAHYSLRDVPLQLLLAFAANDLPMHARGILEGSGDLTIDTAGKLHGQANVSSSEGAIFYVDHPQEPLLGYHALKATLDLQPDQQHLRIGADVQQHGRLDGDVRISGPQQALAGHVAMHLDNLHFVELFTTEVANLKGSLDADLDLAGTLGQPAMRGSVQVQDLSGEIPAAGLKLDQGTFKLRGDNPRALALDGQVRSGKGTLKVSGTLGLGAGQATDIKLNGSQVQVADIPSAQVVVSPDLDIRHAAEGLRVGGSLRVDKAKVELEKLPGAGATQASPDVVVVDAKKPDKQAGAMPVTTDVTVDLGDHTHVTGYGLDGNLHGSLRVLGRPGKDTVGQGQIQVDGTFRAYGQDLHIEQGRLLFASTPLVDPGLDIRAVRKLNPNATVDDGQLVGLQIRGTARHPQLTVFSNPTMEQSDALSYLITGKPLSQVKGGEGNAVNSAAQALGSATGDLLAKGIGAKLGVDAGVSSSDALGTAAFTVGKYLSPKLYLSYGVGLFQPGQVVTLRYILSRRWNFEAEQATEFSRASFNYRIER